MKPLWHKLSTGDVFSKTNSSEQGLNLHEIKLRTGKIWQKQTFRKEKKKTNSPIPLEVY